MSAWLATPEVIEALHVKSPKGTEKNNLHYTGGYRDGDLRSLYKELAEQYRLWIYNGQEDGCIPYTGAEEWTSASSSPPRSTTPSPAAAHLAVVTSTFARYRVHGHLASCV